jgi:hypothetical protein
MSVGDVVLVTSLSEDRVGTCDRGDCISVSAGVEVLVELSGGYTAVSLLLSFVEDLDLDIELEEPSLGSQENLPDFSDL